MAPTRSYADAVSRTSPVVVAGLVTGSVAAAGLLVLTGNGGLAEWLFGSVVLSRLGVVVGQGVGSWRRARLATRRAAALLATDPTRVAREAVRDERRRLADDIGAHLREALIAVADAATAARNLTDPTPLVRDIHQRARQAASELRWQLGLLREPGRPADPAEPRIAGASRWRAWDAALALVVAAVAATEAIAYPRVEGFAGSPLSAALTGFAGATVVAWRAAPGLAAIACGSLYLAGWVFGAPLVAGFWCFAAVCAVLWTVASRPDPAHVDLYGGAFLMASAGTASWITDPENSELLIAIMALSVAGGLVVRLSRRWARTAREAARGRERELAIAAQSAVDAERAAFAREIHDVVSHAVGVIAMQAAAAEVSWPTNPTAAWSSIDIIDGTARSALSELDRLPIETSGPPRTIADITALVERVRAAGTPVDLTLIGDLPPALVGVVYRVVQEALTNVMRHGHGAHARVEIVHSDGQVCVGVADTGASANHHPGGACAAGSAATSTSTRGYGLVGLAERVEFVGGSFTAGPSGNGFHVEARLPDPGHGDAATADALPSAEAAS